MVSPAIGVATAVLEQDERILKYFEMLVVL